jgi:hypothetical protein
MVRGILDQLLESLHILVPCMEGCLHCSVGFNEQTDVKEVIYSDLTGGNQVMDRICYGFVIDISHEDATCGPLFYGDQARYLQDSKSLSDHRSAHLKFLCEVLFRGKTGANFEIISEDFALDQISDLLGVPFLIQRPKDRFREKVSFLISVRHYVPCRF